MIATLNNTCTQMRAHIASAKSDSSPMLDEARTLLTAKHESATKHAVLRAFTTHFLIPDADLDVLTSSAVPVSDHFFVILTRVKKIHQDCEPLLGSENERLGMEMMEQTSRNLDAGFKKLYNWVQRALKGLDFEDPQISGSIRRALRVLAERPSMFQNCLEVLAEAREQTLSAAFQTALSGEGDGAGSAIEFSAHDLLRYMGDMLAWVHSTTVSEKESLEGLFIADEDAINLGMQLGKVSEPWLQDPRSDPDDSSSFDGETALKSLVTRSLSSITSTLQQRIELAIHQHDDTLLLFKAQNLLTFYYALFAKLLSPSSTLASTIASLISTTQAHLHASLDSTETPTAWAANPTTGPTTHKSHLRALDALASVTPPAAWPTAQLDVLLTHYLGSTLGFAKHTAAAEAETDSTDADLLAAIGYTGANIAWVGAHFPVDGRAEQMGIIGPYADRALKTTLEDALIKRVYTSMMDASGVGALSEQLVIEAADADLFLAKLPEFAAQLDDFLADGYAEIAGRVGDKIYDYAGSGDGKREIVEEAKGRFLEELSGLLGEVGRRGGEFSEAYPRTMEDVEVLLG
jgi:hypothetical protein